MAEHKQRYDMRQELDGTWTVFDIFTGMPAEVYGQFCCLLDIEEADDLVDLLNGLYLQTRASRPLN